MKLNLDKEWFARQAAMEEDGEVAAGLPTADFLFAEAAQARRPRECEGTHLAFARLINLKRRESKLSLEQLADRADIELEELWAIERGQMADPEPRTVYQLAAALRLPPKKLMQLSGVTEASDEGFCQEVVRWAARSQPVEQLSREEKQALQEMVKLLDEA